jgi:hypothetical protein
LRPFKGRKNKEEMTNADKIAENLVYAAANEKSLAAMAMIMDRLEGKPQQQRDVTISDKQDVRDQLLKEGRRRLVAMEARLTAFSGPRPRLRSSGNSAHC